MSNKKTNNNKGKRNKKDNIRTFYTIIFVSISLIFSVSLPFIMQHNFLPQEYIETMEWFNNKNLWTSFSKSDFSMWIERKDFSYIINNLIIKDNIRVDENLKNNLSISWSNLTWNKLAWNKCLFNDLENISNSYKESIESLCEKWILKWNNWKFMPNDLVTRGQTMIVLWRLLYWNIESWTWKYWSTYFNKMKEDKIFMLENWEAMIRKGDFLLLLKRFEEKVKINTKKI